MRNVHYTLFILVLAACGQHPKTEAESSYYTQIKKERKEKDLYLVSNGILDEDFLEGFKGLNYFDIDSTLKVRAQMVWNTKHRTEIKTSTEETRNYYVFCQLKFILDKQEHILNAYTEDTINVTYLFVPFKDMTSGHESYPAGRFLEIPYSGEKTEITLDFNQAFNPYCHYNHTYSCPLVPMENILKTSIRAGEKKLYD